MKYGDGAANVFFNLNEIEKVFAEQNSFMRANDGFPLTYIGNFDINYIRG